ncbi:hypothetical protein [Prochlorococcus sp. ALOHA_ZT_50]|jgi:hypothetical protein|uniref:hypothetical protein n=1 Tax=Prochlorococcus sp. ALOHA_ZT_50 TaxID=2919303 RepID=UPI0025807F3D|nr:hypothetical protein [Prochlorococcus sp. ALOHA_ZT_50]MCH2079633.1 hypothetical protein [Prochlorococcus sp. ALOHA_ZT_50]
MNNEGILQIGLNEAKLEYEKCCKKKADLEAEIKSIEGEISYLNNILSLSGVTKYNFIKKLDGAFANNSTDSNAEHLDKSTDDEIDTL